MSCGWVDLVLRDPPLTGLPHWNWSCNEDTNFRNHSGLLMSTFIRLSILSIGQHCGCSCNPIASYRSLSTWWKISTPTPSAAYEQMVPGLTGLCALQGSDRVWHCSTPIPWTSGLDTGQNRVFAGISLGSESFTDLDFADVVIVLSEMLEILILTLEIMHYKALPFGLQINWDETKIQGSSSEAGCLQYLSYVTLLR